jgi:branched-chain amino acid transport system ATP-binding protein
MLLDVRNLEAGYGHLKVLHGVSLAVRPGEIAAVIGANGAGKTTLLRVLSGLLRPDAGEIRFDGASIAGWPPERIAALGLVHIPERRQLFGPLRVEDNLLLGAYLRFRREPRVAIQTDLERVYALFPRLKERRRQFAGTLSGGEQQMLAIGRGLMARPRLVLLDEPSLGLAPLLVRELFRVIAELRAHGQTLLLVEQNARQALRVADAAWVLETGRILLQGEGSSLLASPVVEKAYLGGGSRGPTTGTIAEGAPTARRRPHVGDPAST